MSDKLSKVKNLAFKYGAEDIKQSTRKDKKYMVLYKGKWIHFGQQGYSDFLEHKDPKRRANYRKRAKGIKDGQGRLTYKVKTSPNYWAYNVLW